MNGVLAPDALLVVKLEAQQWNVVMAGVAELKLKDALSLWQVMTEQLQSQLQSQASVANGLDRHSTFQEPAHDQI
jgi:hypothetical protein